MPFAPGTFDLSKISLTAEASESTAVLDETTGTLTLSGNVVSDDVKAYSDDKRVSFVYAEPGTVLPSDCSFLFYDFNTLRIDLHNADTSNVTNMYGMFYACELLYELDLSNFNTAKVTNMQGMFAFCSGLQSIDLSSFDTSKVTDMQGMFAYCSDLQSIDLSSFDTSSVTKMSQMFHSCHSLTVLDLSSFDTSSVTDIYNMFYECDKLQTIFASAKWNNQKVSNLAAFEGCTSIVGGNGTTYDANHIGVAYARIDTAEAPGYFTKSCYTVNKKTGVMTLYGNVERDTVRNYEEALSIKKVVAEDGTVFPADISMLFYGFQNLTEVDLNNVDTSAVTNMNYIFGDCSALEKVNISSWDTSNTTACRYAFRGCSSLRELSLSGWTGLSNGRTAYGNMFKGCSELLTLDISGLTPSTMAQTNMFDGCEKLTYLSLNSGFMLESAEVQ